MSRFGIWVGQFEGTGMAGVAAFESAIRTLLADHEHRQELGRQGRAWVETVHSQASFVRAFPAICGRLSLAGSLPDHGPDSSDLAARLLV